MLTDAPAAGGGLGIVLTGGGARAAYQTGLLRWIGRRYPDLKVPYVTGISAGAINAAMIASHHGSFRQSTEELCTLWQGLTTDDIFRTDLIPGDKLTSIGIHDEPDTATLKVSVHLLIMDHLTQEKHSFSPIFLQCLITDLYRIFHPVTKAKVPGQVKDYWPKFDDRWCKVLLSKIFDPANLFDPAG